MLESRFERVARVPIVFTAGGEEYPIKATTLGVEADWAAAVDSAAREGEGFGPVRGFKRLQTRFFGSEISPPVQVYEAALDFKLSTLARAIDQSHVEAKLVRQLAVEVVPGQSGRRLAQDPAAARIVRALARLERGQPIALPVRLDPVEVTAADLAPAARQARTALSARPARVRGHALEAAALADRGAAQPARRRGHRRRDRRPGCRGLVREAAQDGRAPARGRDVPAGRRRHDRGGSRQGRPCRRRAGDREGAARGRGLAGRADRDAGRRTAQAERTTAEAQAMGIERRLASYTTLYAGTSDRITNLQLGSCSTARRARRHVLLQRPRRRTHGRAGLPARARDHQGRVRGGRRRRRLAGRDDGVQRGLGGGAEDRRAQPAHALHQPLPARPRRHRQLPGPRSQVRQRHTEVALRRRASGGSGITVSIYGGGRSGGSRAGQARSAGDRPRADPPGQGSDALEGRDGDRGGGLAGARTSVTRTVYDEQGEVIHDETWNTSYRGEYRVIRVGTKPPPKPEPKAKPKAEKPVPPTETAPTRRDSALATASTNAAGAGSAGA